MATHGSRSSDLAENRLAKGMTLWSIESSTRIGLHFLEAIEAGDFNQLPGGVYTTSYLRQYARATGFDESALLRRYFELSEPKAEAVASRGPAPQWLRGWNSLRVLVRHVFGNRATGGLQRRNAA